MCGVKNDYRNVQKLLDLNLSQVLRRLHADSSESREIWLHEALILPRNSLTINE